MALCNAIMAVSAYHNHGSEAALPYKSNAVRNLYDSLRLEGVSTNSGLSVLDTGEGDVLDTQIATSMMLCVYSVSFCQKL